MSKDPLRVVDFWSKKKADQVHDACIRHLDIPKTGTYSILDAGCGNGEIINSLRRNCISNFNITGFDCSEVAIQACKERWVGGKWIHAESPHKLAMQGLGPWDFGTVLGPFCYTQGNDKWDCFSLLASMRSYCTHGVGYFMFTDKKDAKPGQVFTRFHPDEVQMRFRDCKVIVEPELIAEYVSGVGYEDLDKGIILW